MITFKELLSGSVLTDVPLTHQHNLEELQKRMNKVRAAYNKPMIVTSGYRSEQQHLVIYSRKGITDRALIPMASGHLRGECVDISDPNGDLRQWCLDNLELLKEIDLYMEDFRYTKGWVHFGIKPPKSKKRIFIPFSGPVPYPELWDGNYDSKFD